MIQRAIQDQFPIHLLVSRQILRSSRCSLYNRIKQGTLPGVAQHFVSCIRISCFTQSRKNIAKPRITRMKFILIKGHIIEQALCCHLPHCLREQIKRKSQSIRCLRVTFYHSIFGNILPKPCITEFFKYLLIVDSLICFAQDCGYLWDQIGRMSAPCSICQSLRCTFYREMISVTIFLCSQSILRVYFQIVNPFT